MTESVNQAQTHRDLAGITARKHGLNPDLVCAIISVESAWNPHAVRYENAWKWHLDTAKYAAKNHITERTEYILQSLSYGLGQVMGAVCRELGHDGSLIEMFDPELNIEFTCLKLKQISKKYSDQNDIIASYNAGSPRRDPVLHRYENADYVDKVNLKLRR